MPELRLRLFGAPEVRLDGEAISFDTRKAVALLAYLTVTERPHRREHLAGLLWPESDQTRARAALRRTLSVAAKAGPALVLERGDVSLDARLARSDVAEFRQLADSEHLEDLERAAGLVRDQFLAGFTLRDSPEFDDWLAATSEQLRDRLADVLRRLTRRHTETGNLESALEQAREWVAVDPLSEPAHRELMHLYTWTGQRTAALRQYRSCVRLLDRELGVPPLPETSALYDDVRANRVEPPHADRPMTTTTPSGNEPTRPESGLAAAQQSLIGRDSERSLLLEKWRAAAVSGGSVSVVGDPGVGRSALTTDIATEVVGTGGRVATIRGHVSERDLALLGMIDLARALSERQPSVAPALAAIGQPRDSQGEVIRMFETVSTAASQALSGQVAGLLVIDDAHWLDPTSTDLVRYLLHRPPEGVLVLATWRSDFVGLDIPATSRDVVTLRSWSQEQLPSILTHLGRSELDSDEVFRRTAGVPRLVVEYVLAAGMPDSATAGQLHDLVAARLDVTPPETRQLLGTAAVIGTVADSELLRQTGGRGEVEVVDAIEDAVMRGLLVEDRQRGGYDFPYDAVRSMVLERMSLARVRLLHRRAADSLIRRHTREPRSAPEAVIARHLAASGQEEQAADWFWRAGTAANSLYAHREAIEHLQSALALGSDPESTHCGLGDALTKLGHYDEALIAYEQAAAAAAHGDEPALAVIEHKLAEVHERLGDWPVAQAHLESAAELLGTAGSPALRGQVLADLALVLQRRGRDESQSIAIRALDLAEESGDDVALAQAHNVLGVLASAAGDERSASEHLTSSRVHAAVSDHELEVASLNNLSRVYARAGRFDEALSCAREALVLGDHLGDQHRIAALNDHLADLLHQAGRDEDAEEYSKAAAAAFARVAEARSRPEIWKLVSW